MSKDKKRYTEAEKLEIVKMFIEKEVFPQSPTTENDMSPSL